MDPPPPTTSTTPTSSGDPAEAIDRLAHHARQLRQRIAHVVIGQTDIVDHLITAVFCQGHALLEGVPGLAKTMLVRTIAGALDLPFSRIQFTPDMMPADVLGADVLRTDPTTGERSLAFVPGPIFASVVLADEINRTPPKTQAALLEAMAERQVSVGGRTRTLDQPFIVVATQNPIEQEGTYPLPEAQLDRFMMCLRMTYPSASEERRVVALAEDIAHNASIVRPLMNAGELNDVRALIGRIPVSDHVVDAAVRLARASRPDDPTCPQSLRPLIAWGAGPRTGQALILAARCRAALRGDPTPSEADVAALAKPVLRHRIVLSYAATADNVRPEAVIETLLQATQLHRPARSR